MPNFIIGMADTTSGYATWLGTPLSSRAAFLIVHDAALKYGKYFGNAGAQYLNGYVLSADTRMVQNGPARDADTTQRLEQAGAGPLVRRIETADAKRTIIWGCPAWGGQRSVALGEFRAIVQDCRRYDLRRVSDLRPGGEAALEMRRRIYAAGMLARGTAMCSAARVLTRTVAAT